MRQEALTTIKAGLSRQRPRGGALKDQLFDLLNGYVTTEKTVRSRPGTTRTATLPAGTHGLVHWDGSFHVFASSSIGGIPAGYTLNIVRSPNGEALSRIHFAEPFLGSLYVAAEFADGAVYHYWLRDVETWQANEPYEFADLVQPTVDNGFRYAPSRNGPSYPQWTANAARALNDRVEPSVFNGYYFQVIEVNGTNPRSGVVEPGWVRDDDIAPGKRYIESVDGTFQSPTPTPPADRDRRPPGGGANDSRYGAGRENRNEERWRLSP